MRIDAHQHFWRFEPNEYGWMQPDWKIRRDYLPSDLLPLLEACNLNGSVAVQARQSLEETRWLLELADSAPKILGVVGWVDLCSEAVEQQLELFAGHGKFVGVRHVVQDEPDDEFMLRNDFQRGIKALQKYGLTYDILVFPRQLRAALELAEAFPQQRFVLDHLGKPPIATGTVSPWREDFKALARLPNVSCKLSGLVTEANWERWNPADFSPYFEIAFEAFGSERLMFGSDWPVALLAGSYQQVFELVQNYAAGLSTSEQERLFGRNAADFYCRKSS